MNSVSKTFKVRVVARGVLAVGCVVMLSACDSDGDMPTKPSPSFTVQPVSSETALDQIAIRVRVLMRVTAGLETFATAVQSGLASAEVCADGCNSDRVVPGPVLGQCDTAVGVGVPEIAAVWLDDDEVGVDFCVSTLTTAQVYTTTLRDGTQPSNSVVTSCALSGGFLACESE